MEPEDVARSIQIANQTEQVRQSSVKSIFDAMNTMQAINRSEQAGDLDVATAGTLRGRLAGQIELDRQQAELARQHAGVFGATKQRIEKMTDAEVNKLLADTGLVNANTETENALRGVRGDLLQGQANQANASANSLNVTASIAKAHQGLTKDKLQAEIDDLRNKADSWVEVKLDDGSTVKLRGETYANALQAIATKDEQRATTAATNQRFNIEQEKQNRKEIEAEIDQANKDESQLLMNKSKEGSLPLADSFNNKSDKQYVYVPNRDMTGPYAKPIPIPKIKDSSGKEVQMNARQLSRLAKSMSPSMTAEQLLDHLYTNVLRKKSPWTVAPK